MSENWILLSVELRRVPQLSYKSDIVVISGLDEGDMKALDAKYRGFDPPCQLDKEDNRFVLKGPKYNHMDVMNILIQQRNYKIQYNPQQHSIPLKQGNTDDKYCMIYHLSKNLPKSKNKGGSQEVSMTDEVVNLSAQTSLIQVDS